jgi:hypothetical protein
LDEFVHGRTERIGGRIHAVRQAAEQMRLNVGDRITGDYVLAVINGFQEGSSASVTNTGIESVALTVPVGKVKVKVAVAIRDADAFLIGQRPKANPRTAKAARRSTVLIGSRQWHPRRLGSKYQCPSRYQI